MKAFIGLAAGFGLIVAASAQVLTHTVKPADPKTVKEVQATYNGYSRACLAGNVDLVMSYFTPDITFKYPHGKTETDEAVRKGIDGWVKNIVHGSKVWFTVDSVEAVNPDTVVANVRLHFDGQLTTAKKKRMKVNDVSRWRDTWVRTPKGWKNKLGISIPVVIAMPHVSAT